MHGRANNARIREMTLKQLVTSWYEEAGASPSKVEREVLLRCAAAVEGVMAMEAELLRQSTADVRTIIGYLRAQADARPHNVGMILRNAAERLEKE